MSTTTRLTYEQALVKINGYNRYSVLAHIDDHDDEEEATTSAATTPSAEPIPSFRITAQELNQRSLNRQHEKKRTRRKKRNPDIAAAENELRKYTMDCATSPQDVLARHAQHEKQRHVLRSFYFSNRSCKESRTNDAMNRKVLDRRAAQERCFISGGNSCTVVLCIGKSGTGVGSRIKGHAKRAGATIRKRHRRYVSVANTNEFCTSKTCSCCFAPVIHPKKRKFMDKWKTVSNNGTSTCINPRCPRYQLGIGSQNRDVLAAECIAISGSSLLLTGRRLACFDNTSNQLTGNHPLSTATHPRDAGQVTVPTVIP